ncbi:SusC/RagA family TonB-linked outer membrane protein [Leeuwenhoekiella blandensis]|uniref:SusC/RagA family TonB-linked outer membrane protein n=1 Tax=Leeuwenhoekiella blandensis TaxID=360293 RepID=UPI0003214AB5|nr:TonB-dependent receptor [Leeuwenhoekiella blandensis]
MKSKITWCLALGLLFLTQLTFAQQKTVTGTVTDGEGLPLPGVNIVVQGTTNGTQTDFDGNYSINAQVNQVLVFTYVGFEEQQKTVGSASTINVQLTAGESLDEVIVVGFGEQTRKSLTTSVAKVEAEEIKSIATPTISGALQGAANGLQVNQNSGAPGGAFSVRVRGASSINGSNEPLYVVDGVPVLSGSIGSNAVGGQTNDVIANLNFSDIESIQVLKDASSAAIYGARGANGVVLITTKEGKAGKFQIEINSYTGFQEEIKRYEVFTAGEYFRWADIALDSQFGTDGAGIWSNAFGYTASEEFYNSDFGDTYVDAIYREGSPIVKQIDATLSGGSEKARFYVNFTDFKQVGVLKGQDFDRRSLTFNGNFQASDKLSIDVGTTISQSDNSRVNGDNNIYGALTTSVLEIPGNDLFNEDGTYNTAPFTFSNPLQNALVDQNDSRTFRMFSNLGLTYKLTDNLTLNSRGSLERIDFKELIFTPATTRRGAPSNGSTTKEIRMINRWNVTNTLNYVKNIGDNFNINALGGFSFEGTNIDNTGLNGTGLPAGLMYPASAAVPITADNSITESKIFSYFGRVGLSYQDKLFLEGTMRADASSVFGSGNAIGYFPAVSGGYLISEEDWFKNNVLTNFKARASWGQTGNQSGIGNFGSRFLAGVSGYGPRPGTSIVQLGAPDLSWETTTQIDLGADITLFDRIDITYDYYNKETTDVLLSRPLRNSSGFLSVAANVGEIRNTGHEVSINARILTGEFTWTSQFQAAYLENEILSLQTDAAGEFIPIDAGFATRLAVGQPLGAFYGLLADGLWQEGDDIPQALVDRGVQPGDRRYVDVNGDGNINANDRAFMGNPLPKWTGNFRNTFTYKGFDLSGNFQFEEDKDIFNNSNAFGGASGSVNFNKFRSQLNYWTPENTDTDLPRPRRGSLQSYNNQDSSAFIEDASYVRLKEVVLGYTFSPEMLGRDLSLRVYIGGDNLVTWTDYSGLDPEVNTFGNSNASRGTDFFTQGLNKVYKLGFNLKF